MASATPPGAGGVMGFSPYKRQLKGFGLKASGNFAERRFEPN